MRQFNDLVQTQMGSRKPAPFPYRYFVCALTMGSSPKNTITAVAFVLPKSEMSL